MRYNRQLVLSTLLSSLLFEYPPVVSAGILRPQKLGLIQRESSLIEEIAIPELTSLASYVCPNNVNVKRQNNSTLPIITVPKDQLRDILTQIQLLEMQFLTLIETLLLGDSPMPSPSELVSSIITIPANTTTTNTVLTTDTLNTTIQQTVTTTIQVETVTSTLLSSSSTVVAVSSTTENITTSTISIGSSLTVAASSSTLDTVTSVTSVDASSTTIPKSNTLLTTAVSSSISESSTLAGGIFAQSSTISTISPLPAVTSVATEGPGKDSAQSTSIPSATSTTSAGGAAPSLGNSGQDPGSSGIPNYTFDAHSSKNVAVYFGQTPVTDTTTLKAQCADPSIDIVILAFVISVSDGGSYPSINFGAACGGQTPKMIQEAPGLLSCPQLEADIQRCQSTYGKKVLLSIGGATAQTAFSAPEQATSFANVLWQLFGPTGSVDIGLRPFGSAVIDGFDVDSEDNLPASFGVLAGSLRTLYAAAPQKSFYLSSAPQCPFPDASDPLDLLLLCDFVWVQFYNNPQCEIGSSGFDASLKQWSTALSLTPTSIKPQLYLGAPAFSQAGSTAYDAIGSAQGIVPVVKHIEGLGLSNFGGVMFWDGAEGMLNTEGGKNIIDWTKSALES